MQIQSAKLRKLSATVRPLKRNTTRWSSTLEMVIRYFEVSFLDLYDKEIVTLIPNAEEEFGLQKLMESITKTLQEEQTDQDIAHCPFSSVMKEFNFENMEHYIGSESGSPTHHPDFEIAISNTIGGLTLMDVQQQATQVLYLPDENSTSENELFFAEATLAFNERKQESDLRWIPRTSNITERLFSRAKMNLMAIEKKTFECILNR